MNTTITYKPNLSRRIFATLIDYGIYFGIFYCYLLYFGTETADGQTVTGFRALPLNIIWLLYFVVVEAASGATVGHTLLDLKVVTLNGRKIGFTQAFKRRLLDPVDILFWGIPAIVAIKNSDKCQRLGDMWATTVVINIKDPAQNLG